MPACAVSICNKRSSTSSLEKDGVTFHFFPKDPELKRLWTAACSRLPSWVPKRTSSICSRHFDASQYRTLPISTSKIRKLVDFAVPTLNLYEKDSVPESIAEPLTQVIKVEIDCDVTQPNDQPFPSISMQHPQPINQNSTLELQVSRRKLIAKVEAQAKKIRRLQAQTLYLKRKVASLEELLKKDEEKCVIVIDNINVESENN